MLSFQKRIKAYEKLAGYGLSLPALIVVSAFFFTPLILLIVMSFYQKIPGGEIIETFTIENYQRFFEVPLYLTILMRTIILSIRISIICFILGYPLAYWLARLESRYKIIFLMMVVFPFMSSVILRAYGFMVILGNRGIINSGLIAMGLPPIQLIWNDIGVTIGQTHIMLPFMVLSLYSAILKIEPTLEHAAQSLGANNWKTFRYIILPLSIPGIVSGSLLVFIITMGTFVIPGLLGGPRDLVISTFIDQQVGLLNFPFAASIAVLLLFIVMLLTAVFASKLTSLVGRVRR